MRAIVPDGHGSVAFADVPEPVCVAGDVVVAVEAFSVNRGETFLLEAPASSWRPGKDVAGTVIATGPDAVVSVGERVVAHPEHSGWAQRVAVSAQRVARLPDGLPTVIAAALPLAGLTALRLVRAAGDLVGRTVLFDGASGGVGHYFVELAAAHGACVTVVSRSPGRSWRLLELGADRALSTISEATDSYDLVIESVGGDDLAAAWQRLRPRGTLIWMGQASRRPPTIDFFDWTGGSSATLRKFLYSDDPTPVASDLATLVRLAATGRLHPEVGTLVDWSCTADVIGALRARRVRGNAVLEVTP